MWTAKTLIRLGGCPGRSFAGCTCHFVGFVMRRLISSTRITCQMPYKLESMILNSWLLKDAPPSFREQFFITNYFCLLILVLMTINIRIKHDIPFINIRKVSRPEGGVENRGRSPRFSISPEEPCEC